MQSQIDGPHGYFVLPPGSKHPVFIPTPKAPPKPLTTAAERLAAFVRSRTTPDVPIAVIRACVGSYYDVSKADMLGERRTRWISHPRQAAMAIAWWEGYSMPRIGVHFNRDHTTVLNATRVCRTRMVENLQFREDLAAINAAIREIRAIPRPELLCVTI